MPAYTDLVRDHHALVYRVALGVLRDSAAAEDVAQDVFLSFFVDPGALDRAQNVRAFVCRAALNRALDVRKAGLRRAVRESAVGSERKNPMNAIEVVFRKELREKVWELPEIQRQAVDLHYFQGLTLAETAEVLDIPNGTASRRISDAVATLRKWLSAAAFAGLVAVIESELGAVEAAPVPEGLAARLLEAPRAVPPPSSRTALSGRTVRVATALGVAILFAVYTGQWIESHDARWNGEAPRLAPVAMAATDHGRAGNIAPLDGSPLDAASATPMGSNVVAAVPEVEQTLEGFLFRTPDGLFLAGEIVPDVGEDTVLRTGERPASEGHVWRLAGGGLDSWPASDTANFTPFLQDGSDASSAPHSRVRLRARLPDVPPVTAQTEAKPQIEILDGVGDQVLEASLGEFKIVRWEGDRAQVVQPTEVKGFLTFQLSAADSSFADDSLNGSAHALRFETVSKALLDELKLRRIEAKPAPESATVLEVLEVELLNDAWLEAWRNLFAIAMTIHRREESADGASDFSALAVQLGDAIRSVRLARAGQSPVAWRIQMENRFSAGAVAALAARGFENLMPGVPAEAELREAFLAAISPEKFTAFVETRWGAEAAVLSIDVCGFRWHPSYDCWGGIAGPDTWSRVILSDLMALSPEEFLACQGRTREGEHKEPATIKNW